LPKTASSRASASACHSQCHYLPRFLLLRRLALEPGGGLHRLHKFALRKIDLESNLLTLRADSAH
jgi:hypothetical protein